MRLTSLALQFRCFVYAQFAAEMGNGKWEMGNGKWEMGNGKWEMGNGKWL